MVYISVLMMLIPWIWSKMCTIKITGGMESITLLDNNYRLEISWVLFK